MTINDLRETLIQSFDDAVKHGEISLDDSESDGDMLHELADSAVPPYNADIMALAGDSEIWGRDPTELGGGTKTLIDMVKVCIFMFCSEWMNEEYERRQKEKVSA